MSLSAEPCNPDYVHPDGTVPSNPRKTQVVVWPGTGGGCSGLLERMVLEDVRHGRRFVVYDPHVDILDQGESRKQAGSS